MPARAVAPLTRKEAAWSRDFRTEMLRIRRTVTTDFAGDPQQHTAIQHVDMIVETIDAALAEYDSRPIWRRWLTPNGGEHVPRLRTVIGEFQDLTARRRRQVADQEQ
jgi:hypothetical protein